MKRNVISSFTDVLLLPVTIVPRAVGGVVMAGGNAAVQGIAMLNPQRWAGSQSSAQANGYTKRFDEEDGTVFQIGPEDEEEEEQGAKPADTGQWKMISAFQPSTSDKLASLYPERHCG